MRTQHLSPMFAGLAPRIPMPTTCVDEKYSCWPSSASRGSPVLAASKSTAIVLMSFPYRIVFPSLVTTTFAAALTACTAPACRPRTRFLDGSVAATALQMAPVPPRAGNRKVALGPQLPAVVWRTTFLVTALRSGAATRSPSHAHCI